MALQPGSGTTAVPVRSAFAGAAFGIAGIVAVLVFAASLSHLESTPRLTGFTWDLKTEVLTKPGTPCSDPNDFGLAHTKGVQAVAAVCVKDVEVDDRAVAGWGIRQLRGNTAPALVSGRIPRTAGEVALGAVTMRNIHKHIGDTVKVALNDRAHTYTVVGQVALPTIDEPQPLADGALLTDAGMAKIGDSGSNETHYLLITAVPGAGRAAIDTRIKELDRLAIATGNSNAGAHNGPSTPVEVSRLQQIDWFPLMLAALLATLALLAVGHALVTSVRRRRRELALLKTMGFDHRQLRATVAWQATTLAAVGLIIGIPIGLLAGNAVWNAIADGLGIAPGSTIPTLAVVLTAVGALAFANLIAFFPARTAARTPAAVALRAE